VVFGKKPFFGRVFLFLRLVLFWGLRVKPAMTRTGGFSFGFVWRVVLPSGSGAC
jgi:hypothetical protein